MTRDEFRMEMGRAYELGYSNADIRNDERDTHTDFYTWFDTNYLPKSPEQRVYNRTDMKLAWDESHANDIRWDNGEPNYHYLSFDEWLKTYQLIS